MKKKDFLMYAFISFIAVGTLSSCSNSDDDIIPDIPPSEGTVMTLNGGVGGDNAKNAVFVDFSAEAQDSVERASWDLAFYSGSQFRVKINNMLGAAAMATSETELSAVNSSNVDLSTLAIGRGQGTMDMIDSPDGKIEGTVIAEVSANANDNKVYVISTKGGTTVSADAVYKVKVVRNGDDAYTLQYAPIDATEFSSLDITKDADYNFQYVSFTTKNLVTVEPKKADWDIVWGYSMYFTGTLPYGFADLVFINHLAGVSAAEVLTTEATFEDFGEANLSSITYSTAVDVIGANWRATSPPATAGVKEDRFYVVKDATGNVYKLRFNSFTGPISNPLGEGPGDGGERGYPEIEFKLVKRG